MATIAENLQAVKERIARAATAARREPSSVRLLAVSKTHPLALVEQAFAAGQRAFGENYVREALDKMAQWSRLDERRASSDGRRSIEWHLIGALQSNKTRAAAERFDWVQTVASEKIARRLSEQRPAGHPPLNVLVQVNVSGEATKSGVSPASVPVLCEAVKGLKNLELRGLMAIPEPTDDVSLQRARFAEVRRLFDELNARGFGLDTLSMGMSDDLEAAIAEGATLVRVGTAIFGARQRAKALLA